MTTLEILILREQRKDTPANYAAWAEALITKGNESPHLPVVAGHAPHAREEELQRLFGAALDSLGVDPIEEVLARAEFSEIWRATFSLIESKTPEVADYARWASDLMQAGRDTPNLRITAGFKAQEDLSEVRSYFYKALDDLNLPNPHGEMLVHFSGISHCQQILRGELEPWEGVQLLYRISLDRDPESLWAIWQSLEPTLDFMSAHSNGDEAFLDRLDEIIKLETARFMEVLLGEIPLDKVKR